MAHELGHAIGRALLGGYSGLVQDNGYTVNDELACSAELEAHMAMYGGDELAGMKTWHGCSHSPHVVNAINDDAIEDVE